MDPRMPWWKNKIEPRLETYKYPTRGVLQPRDDITTDISIMPVVIIDDKYYSIGTLRTVIAYYNTIGEFDIGVPVVEVYDDVHDANKNKIRR